MVTQTSFFPHTRGSTHSLERSRFSGSGSGRPLLSLDRKGLGVGRGRGVETPPSFRRSWSTFFGPFHTPLSPLPVNGVNLWWVTTQSVGVWRLTRCVLFGSSRVRVQKRGKELAGVGRLEVHGSKSRGRKKYDRDRPFTTLRDVPSTWFQTCPFVYVVYDL